MDEIENFGGCIVALERDQITLSIRMLSWNAFNESIKPVLTISVSSYEITHTSAPSLEETRDKEYEVDGLEIDKGQLSIWVYDFDKPIRIKGKSISFEFSELGPNETRLVLSASRKAQEGQYRQIAELRRKLGAIEKFVLEAENRINLKSKGHPEGTEGYKMYKGQLELLRRIKHKLNT
jgi:Mg2+ and Co2+ transporter CorA